MFSPTEIRFRLSSSLGVAANTLEPTNFTGLRTSEDLRENCEYLASVRDDMEKGSPIRNLVQTPQDALVDYLAQQCLNVSKENTSKQYGELVCFFEGLLNLKKTTGKTSLNQSSLLEETDLSASESST